MTTLIIHAHDESTVFLRKIYEGIENKIVISGDINESVLEILIDMCSTVIMLGHGTPCGLIGYMGGFVISSTLVPALQRKGKDKCIFIWCYAQRFVSQHGLEGLCSDMFISEVGEAAANGIVATQDQVDSSNNFFAELLGSQLTAGASFATCFEFVKIHYGQLALTCEVAAFNHKRWYYYDGSDVVGPTKLSFHRHPIEPSEVPRTLQNAVCCDVCEKVSASYYWCRRCNWDICKECFTGCSDVPIDSAVADQIFDEAFLACSEANVVLSEKECEVATARKRKSKSKSKSYPLRFEHKHMFIDFDEGTALIDTGSPVSFGTVSMLTYGADDQFSIRPSVMGMSLDRLAGLPQVRNQITALMGMDIMSSDVVLWDGVNSVATVGGDSNEFRDPASLRCQLTYDPSSLIIFEATVNGRSCRCAFDTGAQYGYVLDRSLMKGVEMRGYIDDYSPILQQIHCESWVANVTISEGSFSLTFPETFGILSADAGALAAVFASQLVAMGIDVIVGNSWMASRKILFVPQEPAMYITADDI